LLSRSSSKTTKNQVERSGYATCPVAHQKSPEPTTRWTVNEGVTTQRSSAPTKRLTWALGRNVIDNFETAIERNERKKGFVIAFSFGRGAIEEVARAKSKLGVDIELVSVQELLDRRHPLAQEPTNLFGATLAPPAKRDPATLPTIDELLSGLST
jgi:hypothetical protein